MCLSFPCSLRTAWGVVERFAAHDGVYLTSSEQRKLMEALGRIRRAGRRGVIYAELLPKLAANVRCVEISRAADHLAAEFVAEDTPYAAEVLLDMVRSLRVRQGYLERGLSCYNTESALRACLVVIRSAASTAEQCRTVAAAVGGLARPRPRERYLAELNRSIEERLRGGTVPVDQRGTAFLWAVVCVAHWLNAGGGDLSPLLRRVETPDRGLAAAVENLSGASS